MNQYITRTIMKKKNLLLALSFMLLSGAYAQSASVSYPPEVTSIPRLNAIISEMILFESKDAGKSESYKHANEDRKALKTKYAMELQDQITMNKDKPKIVAALNAELQKTQTEIKNLSR